MRNASMFRASREERGHHGGACVKACRRMCVGFLHCDRFYRESLDSCFGYTPARYATTRYGEPDLACCSRRATVQPCDICLDDRVGSLGNVELALQ